MSSQIYLNCFDKEDFDVEKDDCYSIELSGMKNDNDLCGDIIGYYNDIPKSKQEMITFIEKIKDDYYDNLEKELLKLNKYVAYSAKNKEEMEEMVRDFEEELKELNNKHQYMGQLTILIDIVENSNYKFFKFGYY